MFDNLTRPHGLNFILAAIASTTASTELRKNLDFALIDNIELQGVYIDVVHPQIHRCLPGNTMLFAHPAINGHSYVGSEHIMIDAVKLREMLPFGVTID